MLTFSGLISLLVSCSPKSDPAALAAVLTSDHWMIELGSGMLQERHVYTFYTNGSYKACAFSTFGTRPVKGTWKTAPDKQGRMHLLLDNEEAYYFFLWRDSIIRYDKQKDALAVSGPQYGGEKALWRTRNPKGHTNSPPFVDPKPAPPQCRTRVPRWRYKMGSLRSSNRY